jgi:hypothetical protein
MDQATAHLSTWSNHVGQYNRLGLPVIEHAERVATAVPPDARAAAWLHDLLEPSPITWRELWRQDYGLTPAELRLVAFPPTQLSLQEIGDRLYLARPTAKNTSRRSTTSLASQADPQPPRSSSSPASDQQAPRSRSQIQVSTEVANPCRIALLTVGPISPFWADAASITEP